MLEDTIGRYPTGYPETTARDSVIAIEDGLLIVCYDHTPGGQIVSVTVSRVFGPKDTSFSSSLSLSLLKGIVVINQIFYLYERK